MSDAIHRARTIDIHAHAVLDETLNAAGTYGPELGVDEDDTPWYRIGEYRLRGVRYRGSPFMDVDARLARMDAANIDFQILSPNPLTYFHFIPAPDAIRYCRIHNDALAVLVSAHSERLAAFAQLPMQDIGAACEELDRAVTELGMWGAGIGASMPFALDAEELNPFYRKLIELDVPLYIHPAPAGIDGPEGDPGYKRYEFDIMLGFSAQETLAAATLVIGGVLDRHPELDVCISHGGGAIAFAAGRLAEATRRRAWSPDYLKVDGAFEERLKRLWFDTHVHDDRSLRLLTDVVGADHLVLGTNFAGWDQPDDVTTTHLPDVDLAGNARRLLRKGG